MDKLKDPAMALASANSLAMMGGAYYFYKQMEQMRADMVKMADAIKNLRSKFNDLDKSDQNKEEKITSLNDQVKNLSLEYNPEIMLGTLDVLEEDLHGIVSTLEDHDIPVELPSQKPKRITSYRRQSENTRKNYGIRLDSSRDSMRESYREPRELREEKRRQKYQVDPPSEEDTVSLINAVRGKQGY